MWDISQSSLLLDLNGSWDHMLFFILDILQIPLDFYMSQE